MWREAYEDDQLIEKVDKLWDEVKPLYDELHKYVRYQLRELYGDKIERKSEFLPAHLLGNMWVSILIELDFKSYNELNKFRRLKLGFIFMTASSHLKMLRSSMSPVK